MTIEIDELIAGFRFPASAPVACKSAAVTKSVDAQVQPVEDSANPNGEFVLIATDFDPNGWMPLPARVHVDTDYGSADGLSVPNTAGSGKPEITDNGDLIIRGTWASTPHAQMTRQLVNEGHVWAASLLYLTHPDGRRELLNGTFAGVPDPGAPKGVVLSSKSRSVDNGSDAELIRAVHDAAVAFGAKCRCGTKQAKRTRRTKARDPRVSRAAVMARAHARARKFALDQSIDAVMAEMASPSK